LIRACKHNKAGICTKYKTPDDLAEDFKSGGGCAFTWFFFGKLPEGESR